MCYYLGKGRNSLHGGCALTFFPVATSGLNGFLLDLMQYEAHRPFPCGLFPPAGRTRDDHTGRGLCPELGISRRVVLAHPASRRHPSLYQYLL